MKQHKFIQKGFIQKSYIQKSFMRKGFIQKRFMQKRFMQNNRNSKRVLRWSLLCFTAVFLTSLVVAVPARLGQLLPLPGQIHVSRWNGTVWQGTADHVALTNAQGLVLLEGQLAWDISLGSLLRGKLCTAFYAEESLMGATLDDQAAQVQGEVCWRGDTINLNGVSFSLPAERLLYNSDVSLSGLIQGRINALSWQLPGESLPARIAVSGQGQWRDIALTVPGMTALRQVDWPDMPFTLSSPDNDSLRVETVFDTREMPQQESSPRWPIDALSMNLNLALSGEYETEILLMPDENMDQELNSWLAMLADEGAGDYAGGYRYFIASP